MRAPSFYPQISQMNTDFYAILIMAFSVDPRRGGTRPSLMKSTVFGLGGSGATRTDVIIRIAADFFWLLDSSHQKQYTSNIHVRLS